MRYLIVLLSTLIVVLSSCKKGKPNVKHVFGEAFGSTYSVKYVGDEEFEEEIIVLLDSIDASLSTYNASSLISQINQNNTDSLDRFLKEILDQSLLVYQITEGYFDPTVSSLLKAFGLNTNEIFKVPEEKELDDLLSCTGLNKVKWSEGKLAKDNLALELGFNAVAPGYAADLIGVLLTSMGIENYLIEVGGEILSRGHKPNKEPWKVGIDIPEKQRNELLGIVPIRDEALATSGNYRNFRIDSATGNKYVHTINPKTGAAMPSDLLSVTVMAKNCTHADAFATAFMAMGKEKAINLIKNKKLKNLKVLLVFSDKQGEYQTERINGFQLQ